MPPFWDARASPRPPASDGGLHASDAILACRPSIFGYTIDAFTDLTTVKSASQPRQGTKDGCIRWISRAPCKKQSAPYLCALEPQAVDGACADILSAATQLIPCTFARKGPVLSRSAPAAACSSRPQITTLSTIARAIVSEMRNGNNNGMP